MVQPDWYCLVKATPLFELNKPMVAKTSSGDYAFFRARGYSVSIPGACVLLYGDAGMHILNDPRVILPTVPW